VDDDALKHRLYLVDGSSLAYRAYFALPETIATRDGFPTNALYGFSQMMLKIVAEYEPAAVVVAWDAREKTFRHDAYEAYKAQRPQMPELLSQQWEHFPQLVEAFGFVNLVQPGYEADDILGTLALRACKLGARTIIVTGDRDTLQLVNDCVWVMSTGRGITDVKVYTPAAVVARFGVTPAMMPDYIGFKGDTSDNIPGVPGIGEKTAAALLQQFGSLEAVYENLDEVGSEKRRALLAENEHVARLSKQLATMALDVPLDVDVQQLAAGHYTFPAAEVEAAFARWEFASLVRRVRELAAARRAPGGEEAWSGAPAAEQESMPSLALQESLGTLATLLEQKESALAWAPAGDGAKGRYAVAAYSGGPVVPAAVVSGQAWEGLWRLAAHVIGHDVKSFPGFAAAPAPVAHDTAVAAYLLAPERMALGLSALAGVDDSFVLAGPQAEAEAATRAVLTWRVAASQRPRLENLGLGRLFRETELPLERVLARMEAVGVRMDPYRLGEITARVRERAEEVQDRVYELAGGPFTIGSPQQLAEVLFGRLGLVPLRRGKTGYSTDARVLRTLRELHPIVPLIEEWRELTKLLNTYLERLPEWLDPATGRLHTTFNQTVTSTGRLSSSNPNLQNIPVRTELGAEIRGCFVADEGARLVVADYSQIELRLMAQFAQEPALLEAFRRGEDVHRATAAAVAGIPVEQVTRQQRERAKATNFGIMYGLSAYGLSEQIEISVEEARAFIDAYFARYPKVKAFRDRVILQATEDGYVTTILGRRRAIPELHGRTQRERSLGERLAVNTVLQGSAADIIKMAMVLADRELEQRKMGARLVLQVHDELIFEAPLAEVEQVTELARRCMCCVYDMDPPLDVHIGVGENWRDAK
jgi:DNA polymerase-1